MNIPDADAPFIIKALDHYQAFLEVQRRDGRTYREIMVRIQQPAEQPERKAPVSEMPLQIAPKRKKKSGT